ncbi:unnamed protein product [Rotaria sp. Silwood2]|nr:unnamed protein product [Rotaria sp. Silwood2]
MADDKCNAINQLKNSEWPTVINSTHLNKYRRAISYEPHFATRRKRITSSNSIVFLPFDDDILEENENPSNQHSSSDDVAAPQNGEARLTFEEDSAKPSTRKMHSIKAWYHRTIPDYITCHHVAP